MEQEDVFEPIEPTSKDVTTGQSFVVDQVVEREPYTGIWTDKEVDE